MSTVRTWIAGFLTMALAPALVLTPAPSSAGPQTQPVRLRPTARSSGLGAYLPLVASGALLTLVAIENEDSQRTARLLDHSPLEFGADPGNIYGDGRLLAAGSVGLWLGGRLFHHAETQQAGRQLTESFALTSAAVWSLKVAIGRDRPGGGSYSFPSGHTATAFAVAPVLMDRYGWKVGVPAYALATATALGRMEDRRHHLSDVVCGATLGILIGKYVVRDGAAGSLFSRVRFGKNKIGLAVKFE